MATSTYHGSCHCGKVRFTARIDLAAGTGKCNCSYCSKIRAWKAFVAPDKFALEAKNEDLLSYHRHPQAPLKHACRHCSVVTHETGEADYMGGAFVGVFLGTLDDVTPEALAAAPVRYSNGRDDKWGEAPQVVSYL